MKKTKQQQNNLEGEKTPLSSFLVFKNKETEPELIRLIGQYEGVLPEQMVKYINAAHAKASGELLFQARQSIKRLWREHPNLSLSEIKGVVELAMYCITDEVIKKGDAFMESMKKGELKR